ncbi:UNVERIFIED_CONTAM: hypothetical protein Sradi_3309200 [Sesamum radiatum]|uniref:Uncharacterized protein n=1 Tax=Sesamum radiatum TaxID=300843 RepID=A0AAW2R143_SESRA
MTQRNVYISRGNWKDRYNVGISPKNSTTPHKCQGKLKGGMANPGTQYQKDTYRQWKLSGHLIQRSLSENGVKKGRSHAKANHIDGVRGEHHSSPREIALPISLGEKPCTKTIVANFITVDTEYPSYNIILRRSTLDVIGAIISTKFPTRHGVGEVRGDQRSAREWKTAGVNEAVIQHELHGKEGSKPIRQKKQNYGNERNQVIQEEVQRLLKLGYIREVQYPEWISNVVLEPKTGGKWRMCVDFTDLNKACPKDSYRLSRIDLLWILPSGVSD